MDRLRKVAYPVIAYSKNVEKLPPAEGHTTLPGGHGVLIIPTTKLELWKYF